MHMPKLLTRKILLMLCCCFVATTIFSQQYSKYVVVFKNKKNSPYKISRPRQFLSVKAINRRIKYNIPVDSTDFPVNPAYITKVLEQGTVTYLSQSRWLNQILIYTTSSTAVQKIKNLASVKSVNPVGPASTTLKTSEDKFREETAPASPSMNKNQKVLVNYYNYGNSYGQVHIHNGEFLHNKGFTGKGITIAMLDAGFYHYKTTKAFDSVRARNGFLGEKDFVDFDNSVNEDNSHGEFCLSIIASNVPGVMVGTAPNANFWLLRSENTNSEYPIEEHNWAAAAAFADSAGADMITSSLGYMQFDDPQFNHTYNDFYKNATTVSRAATFAAKKGMIVTNSAGNEGSNAWKYIIFPSDDDSVCAVAATDVSGSIASFSSYGYTGKVKPNIASVGSGTAIYSYLGPTYGNGTSFSNPNINGLIACLWQAFPQFNNMTILNAVYKTADRYLTPDNRYGYGIPNMQKAYNSLKNMQNVQLYGNEWLITSTDFTNKIAFKLIGRVDGAATIKLMNENNKTVATLSFKTEQEEVYDKIFNGLEKLADGKYLLQYNDGINSKTVILNKQTAPVAKRQVETGVVAKN